MSAQSRSKSALATNNVKASQPNVVLIMADQLAAQALSLYGNSVCKAPNIDRLAKQGTVFDSAYSNNPLCVPSRASMLTGKLSTNVGVYDNANEIPSSTPTMAHYLRKAGYQTELCGKMHFIGPDQYHGFNTRTVTDVYPANYQWIADWSAGPAFVPSGTALNGVVEAGSCVRTMQEDYDDEVEHTCIQGLYNYAREPNGSPFFQVVSFTSPHTPFTVAQEYWDRYASDEIDAPAVGELPFEELDFHSKALFFAHGRHRHRVTRDHVRDARHAYYGMISYLDDKVGRILDTLEKTGLADNTVVAFTSDHGEMLGERGMWFKQSFWEWSAHVPLIVSMPGAPSDTRCSSVVSLVDLLPTFLDVAGLKEQHSNTLELDGTSLLPLVRDPTAVGRDTAISDYLAIGPCVPCRMVVNGKFKYILTDGHPSLLYNLESDPNELDNLIEDSTYSDTIDKLHAIACADWNPQALTSKVLLSQKQRNFIANIPGDMPSWDHVSRIGDENRYVRKEGVDATKGKLRLPPVPAVLPDWPELSYDSVEALMSGKRSLNEFIDR